MSEEFKRRRKMNMGTTLMSVMVGMMVIVKVMVVEGNDNGLGRTPPMGWRYGVSLSLSLSLKSTLLNRPSHHYCMLSLSFNSPRRNH